MSTPFLSIISSTQLGDSLDSNKGLDKSINVVILFTLITVLVKMGLSTLTFQDSFGFLIVVSLFLALRITDYLYPKRPDLFLALEKCNNELSELKSKLDAIESDMTGVKFGLKTRP